MEKCLKFCQILHINKLQKTQKRKKNKKIITIEDNKIRKKLFADQHVKQNTCKKKKTGTASIPSTSTAEDNSEVKCPACLETYEDPPRENWIRCQDCLKWCHEEWALK